MMNGLCGPTEISRFCPESVAISALIDPDTVQLMAIPFTALNTSDEWTARGGTGSIHGYVELGESIQTTSILIIFPGFYERCIARLRRREPRATLNITIADNIR